MVVEVQINETSDVTSSNQTGPVYNIKLLLRLTQFVCFRPPDQQGAAELQR